MKGKNSQVISHIVTLILFLFRTFSLWITMFPSSVYAATPSAPTNVAVTAGSGSAIVVWSGVSASPAVSDYQVEYKLSSAGGWSIFSDGVSTTLTTTVTGLTNETGYDFRISAINTDGTSSPSSVSNIMISAVPMPAFFLAFDGDYNDGSTNGVNGINAGSASIVTDATRGQVVKMLGASDSYVNVPAPLPPSFTKSAWVYATVGGIRNIMTNGTYGAALGANIFQLNGLSQLNAAHFSGGSQANYATDPAIFLTGQWIHVAETYDSTTKKYTLYKNGAYVISGTAAANPLASTGVSIGAYTPNNGVWSGFMDNAEMRSGALSASQVQSIYNGNIGVTSAVPSAPTNLTVTSLTTGSVSLSWSGVGAYPSVTDYIIEYKISTGSTWNVFSDGVSSSNTGIVTGLAYKLTHDFRVTAVNAIGNGPSGSVATGATAFVPEPLFVLTFEGNYNDISSNSNNGINAGTASIGVDPTAGRSGQVVKMNGTANSCVQMSVALPTNFTKAAWVYLSTSSASRNIMTNGVYGTNTSNIFTVDATPSLKVGQFLPTQTYYITTSFSLGQWIHVAETYNDTTKIYTLYKNGALVATGLAGASPRPTTGLTIGGYDCSSAGTVWSGYMDDVEMWNSVMTPLQMQLISSGNIGMDQALATAVTNLRATAGSGLVNLSWSGVTAYPVVSDYQIEYKLNTGSSWSAFSDGVSTALTGSVTGLTNGIVYDFRVSAVSSLGTGASATVSGLPRLKMIYFQILSNGQSLSLGSTSTATNTTQPYTNVALSSGASGGGKGWTGFLTPLIEVSNESPSSSMANSIRAYSGLLSFNVAMGLHGIGSSSYSALKKGTTPYTTGSLQATNTKALVEATGGVYVPLAVTIVHGEDDSCNGAGCSGHTTGSVYEADLQEWQRDYQNDVNTLMGSSGVTLPMFISQMSAGWSGDIAVAQYNAHKNNPGKVILIGPKYQYNYFQSAPINVHLDTTGYKHLGEMFAKVIQRTLLTGQILNITSSQIWNPVAATAWNPLMPSSVVRAGNVITVSYYIPVGTLAIDTGNVAQRTNYGFEFAQSGGAATTISSVVLTGGNTQVQITLSGTPTGTNQLLRYAYSCGISALANTYPVGCASANNASAVGGNIRDTDTSVSPEIGSTGLPLYDRGVTFEEPVTSFSTPNAPTNISATASSGAAQIQFSGSTDSGGSAILYYVVTSSPGSLTATGAGTPITLSGLTNGVAYTFTVTAVNAVGAGTASSASNSVTPATVPTVPTSISATGGNTQVTISFVSPINTGGSAVLYYNIRSNTGALVVTGGTPSINLTGLTNGTSYLYYVSATNGAGEGASGSVSVTPADVPSIPTSISAVAGSGSATISFGAPVSSGGAAITYYTIRSTTGVLLTTGTVSPISLTGLTNGTTYTYYVAAVSSAGEGASGSVNVTPITVPTVPTSISATAGSGQATISFGEPTYTGGSAIQYYTIRSTTGVLLTTGSSSPIVVSGLTNGTTYTYYVSANNGAGEGASGSVSVTPVTLATVPTSISATATSGGAQILFSSPLSSGGSAIQYYAIRSNTGVLVTTGSASPISIAGLTNGVSYTFTVSAVNGVGEGASGSVSVTPVTTPNAPTSVSATAGNGSATIIFSGSTDSGGSAVLYYIVTSSPGSFAATGSGSPITVNGLSNGTAYTFTVAAVSALGTGTSSSASNSVTPITTANAPTSVSATGGNAEATVTFSSSTNTGGSAILYYIVTSSVGGLTATGSASPIRITGLTNGTSYAFTVVAINGAGTGVVSSGSNSVTPITTANAPTDLLATAGSGTATIVFSGSTNTGGSALLYYLVTSSGGGITATGSSSPIIVNGLTNGTTYTFTVVAINGAGTGTLSSASNSVTPAGNATAPTSISAIAGSGSATISFGQPTFTGGSAIQYYTIRSTTGVLLTTGSSSPIIVSGLTNGTTYTYYLAAVNGVGEGASGSVSVTPITTANAPTSVTGTGGSGQATITFTSPTSSGGSTILYYIVTSSPGGFVGTGTGSPILVTGLTNGVGYTFTVTAINGAGTGTASSASSTVTPATVATVPTSISGTGASGQAILTFSAPLSSGGSAIQYYTVRSMTGLLMATGSSSPLTVVGLANGTGYTFALAAVNGIGEGASGTVSVTTPSISLGGVIVSGISATGTNISMSVVWTTSVATTTQIQYGLSTSYGTQTVETNTSPRVTSHTGSLTGLFDCATYHYRFIGTTGGGQHYTGSDNEFITLGCTHDALILSTNEENIDVTTGGVFTMSSSISTSGEIVVPAGVILTGSVLTFQAKELDSSDVLDLLGTPDTSLSNIGAIYDLKAYVDNTTRITTFDTAVSLSLTYRDADIAGIDESTLHIYSYEDGGTGWSALPGCTVNQTTNTVTCEATHFSTFAIFGEAQATISGGGAGGIGGGSSTPYLLRDFCPTGDSSPSYYDRICSGSAGISPLQSWLIGDTLTKCADRIGESMQSFCFASTIGSTTKKTLQEAHYDDMITRAQTAKIMSEFAIKILGKSIDPMKKCEFTQAYDDPGLAASMVKACKLGLMNLTRPDDVLTRGEYMTILSRMLYGNKYELQPSEVDVYPFYQHHMDKIYAEGLVKLKDPEQLSQRYVVFLTLYRLAQRLVKNPQ